MATCSSILVWKMPWIEEPAGLQSMGWQRFGHNWAHVYIHSNEGRSCCSTISPPTVSVTVSDFVHSNRSVIVSVFFLNHISLMIRDVKHISTCLFVIFISSLVRCLLRSLTHFIIGCIFLYGWVLRILCELDANSFSDVLLQTFSPSLWFVL